MTDQDTNQEGDKGPSPQYVQAVYMANAEALAVLIEGFREKQRERGLYHPELFDLALRNLVEEQTADLPLRIAQEAEILAALLSTDDTEHRSIN